MNQLMWSKYLNAAIDLKQRLIQTFGPGVEPKAQGQIRFLAGRADGMHGTPKHTIDQGRTLSS